MTGNMPIKGSRFPIVFLGLILGATAISLFVLSLIEQTNLALEGLTFISFPAILASLIYIFTSHKHKGDRVLYYRGGNRLKYRRKILFSLFFLSFGSSFVVQFYTRNQPLIYYILLVIAYGVIFVQLFSNTNEWILVIEVVMLFLSKIYSIIIVYPIYYGSTDIFFHQAMVEYISEFGRVPRGQPFSTYTEFPLYHILGSSVSSIIGLDVLTSIFLAFPIILSTVLILVFHFTREAGNSTEAAIMSMVILSLLPSFVYYSGYTVTRVLAFVGFVFLIYSGLRYRETNSRVHLLLFLLIMIYTILVHQASIFQFMVILFVLYLAGRMANDKAYIDAGILTILVTITVGYWVMVSPLLSSKVIRFGIAGLLSLLESTGGGGASVEHSATLPLFELIRNRIFILSTSMLLILGTIYMIDQKTSNRIRTYGIVALLLSPLFLPSPLLFYMPDELNIERIDLFITPFVAIAIGYSIVYLQGVSFSWTTKIPSWNIASYSVPLIVFLVLTFSMVTAPMVTYDTSFNNEDREYFTASELDAIHHSIAFIPENSDVRLDSYTGRYFSKYHNNVLEYSRHYTKKGQFRTNETYSVHAILIGSDYFLFRKGEFERSGLRLATVPGVWAHPSIHSDQLRVKVEQSNKVYSSDSSELLT